MYNKYFGETITQKFSLFFVFLTIFLNGSLKAQISDASSWKSESPSSFAANKNFLLHYADGRIIPFLDALELEGQRDIEKVFMITLQNEATMDIIQRVAKFKVLKILDLSHNNLSCDNLRNLELASSVKKVYLNNCNLDDACQLLLKSKFPTIDFVFEIKQTQKKY